MDDAKLAVLCRRVRELMRASELPLAPRHVYGGTADGDETCAVCRLKFEKGKIAFEVDVDEGERRKTLFTHPDCYTAWQQESIEERRRSQK